MRIVFFGSGEFGLPVLEALVDQHDVAAVVSQPDRPAGRKKVLTPTAVSAFALAHNLPLIRTDNANAEEVVSKIQSLQSVAGVVIAFGQKLSPQLIEACGDLAINLHASLLPKYRGAAPINWAMIKGERETGVSVISLAQRMDAGLIYATAKTPIDSNETAGELHDRLANLGPDVVLGVLNDFSNDSLCGEKQDDALATKAPKLSKTDGVVDFNQSATHIRQRIHGLTPWPGVRVTWHCSETGRDEVLMLRRVQDLHCESSRQEAFAPGTIMDDTGRVACAAGILQLKEVQLPGKTIMQIDDFLRGHPMHQGDVLLNA